MRASFHNLLDSYLEDDELLIEIETPHDCTCSQFMDKNGLGMCQISSVNTSANFCYVNEPSNCKDLVYNEMEKRYYSEQACLNILGKSTHVHQKYLPTLILTNQTVITG